MTIDSYYKLYINLNPLALYSTLFFCNFTSNQLSNEKHILYFNIPDVILKNSRATWKSNGQSNP